ncbi:beta-ketoacyl-ACP synthase [Kangiella koreensis]|uniref:Beta-ketoacyl synthase n=1 Tax=Kangiella koreensis (strain DSM 16069 / JCM 12317 / KCTC 12182 / SW-125) TaxID=523791 RepID=C7R9X8_KANKD|nr:beta-ketoacyl-ACP synthase [Kangiella koreensis]ACV27997.1 Beta-ketoacyl synthase [Kangiella koreensis DSM 16069]
MSRVVITGMSGITAFGDNWNDVQSRLLEGKNAVQIMSQWAECEGLRTSLAAPVDYTFPKLPRKRIRSMGRVSLLATCATQDALAQAGLLEHPALTNGDTGISYGSSSGSTRTIPVFGDLIKGGPMTGFTSTSYVEMMSHTAPVNMGVFFGCKGRIIPTSSACTSGSQGIGYAYEAIKFGRQKVMIAGGAEELCITQGAVFDSLFATSVDNQNPQNTPRPFDKDRDGLVIGEGAGTLILEDYDHAVARGASILAEIVGFGCNSDGAHVTQPQQQTMSQAMQMALDDAQLSADAIGYVSAHGTATDRGDVAETQATRQVFNRAVPISSLKSYFGHTLGACGAIEAWLSIEMMNNNWYAPTLNLTNLDPDCANLDYIVENNRQMAHDYIMSNNFAFGGINTSLIFKKV